MKVNNLLVVFSELNTLTWKQLNYILLHLNIPCLVFRICLRKFRHQNNTNSLLVIKILTISILWSKIGIVRRRNKGEHHVLHTIYRPRLGRLSCVANIPSLPLNIYIVVESCTMLATAKLTLTSKGISNHISSHWVHHSHQNMRIISLWKEIFALLF